MGGNRTCVKSNTWLGVRPSFLVSFHLVNAFRDHADGRQVQPQEVEAVLV